VNFSAKQISLV